MTPAPHSPDPAFPGTAAQPWLEISRRAFKRAAHYAALAWDRGRRPFQPSDPESTDEWRISHFWARVAKRAHRMANVDPLPPPYRPTPGKFAVDPQNRIVKVKRYGLDLTTRCEYVEVQLSGSYAASVRLPLSAIRRMTERERVALGAMVDAGWFHA